MQCLISIKYMTDTGVLFASFRKFSRLTQLWPGWWNRSHSFEYSSGLSAHGKQVPQGKGLALLGSKHFFSSLLNKWWKGFLERWVRTDLSVLLRGFQPHPWYSTSWSPPQWWPKLSAHGSVAAILREWALQQQDSGPWKLTTNVHSSAPPQMLQSD